MTGRSTRSRAGPGARGPGGATGRGIARGGAAGLAASTASVLLTVAVAVAGPSVMEPALPGRPGQPPWSFGLAPSPYLAVALTAAALAAGTAGLGLCLRAIHRGWRFPAGAVLAAGLAAGAAMAVVPPFGSSDHLSYVAYGRMVTTGHDPYTTTPAALARLGDPVARAVLNGWRNSPSVYGSLATGGQALASWIGGDSVRLTVFVLSVLNVAAFAGTGLILHRLTAGSPARQLRAALLWTFNPLLLQVLVAGAHVDSQAIVFGAAAIAVFSLALPGGGGAPGRGQWPRVLAAGAGAGAIAGLGFAVKLTMVLIPAGLVIAAAALWWPRTAVPAGGGQAGGGPPAGQEAGGRGARAAVRGLGLTAAGMAAGFAVTAGAAFAPWGPGSLGPALHAGGYVSIGSPWRPVRSALVHLVGAGEPVAGDVVRAGAIVLLLALVVLFLRPLRTLVPAAAGPRVAALAAAGAFAVAFAWLMAWPYVLPWYDGLAWAPLALVPLGPGSPRTWLAMDWLLLARTAALSFGYLPARGSGITMPADMGWLVSVVRTGVTPVILLAVTVAVVFLLWPRTAGAPPAGARLVRARAVRRRART